MKKRSWLLILGVVFLAILTACNDESAEENENSDELLMLEVELNVAETVDVGETVDLSATVTYGDEAVADADEVEYEVWEKGLKDESYRLEATNNEDGTYTAETTFDKDGIYHVQVHVTAKDLHTMPQKEVTVGEGGDYSDLEEENDDSHGDH
ncbi:FixH family protein [Ornithinibacillus halophilus]|uniref:YtkA-like n=1 Tax=Ornithinibacillus halophilus TaxID=930117 RepID=A0A1M5J6D1_9BACI|nr:FixH family protein [Ornithinibacillus halophilus]SHG36061.1 YtkA-like [Ornithinibacillus halophilus]